TYVSGSGTAALNFKYTVKSGQNTPALAITGVTIPASASIKDSSGQAVDVTGAIVTLPGPIEVDTTRPAVTSIVASPAPSDLKAGDVLTLTVNMSEAVLVTGVPTLHLNDGGIAAYVSGSGTNALVFSYTVLAGQNADLLSALGIFRPPGSTITDGAGNFADVTGSKTALIGDVGIDTRPPVVTEELASDTGLSVHDEITSDA